MTEANGDHRWNFFCQGAGQVLAHAGARRLSALQTLEASLAKERKRLLDERPKVFLAVPSYDTTGMHDRAWARFMIDPSDKQELDLIQSKFTNSLLARSMNHLWAQALVQRERSGITHFAMLHTDVAPEQFWLDKLYEEMIRVEADLIAAVIPIKSPLGLTSVAIDNPEDPWELRRLTMTEVVEKLPETFNNDDVIAAGLNPNRTLLLQNTGCWLCDLWKPWVDATDENGYLRVFFTINDCIRMMPEDASTKYFVGVQPEDWNFSRAVQTVAPKARIFGTRKVFVEHIGQTGYPNTGAWGQWKTDEMAQPNMKTAEESSVDIPISETTEALEPVTA